MQIFKEIGDNSRYTYNNATLSFGTRHFYRSSNSKMTSSERKSRVVVSIPRVITYLFEDLHVNQNKEHFILIDMQIFKEIGDNSRYTYNNATLSFGTRHFYRLKSTSNELVCCTVEYLS
jgi:hypothetical protein